MDVRLRPEMPSQQTPRLRESLAGAAREPESLHFLARVLRAARLGEGLASSPSCRTERRELGVRLGRPPSDAELGVTF